MVSIRKIEFYRTASIFYNHVLRFKISSKDSSVYLCKHIWSAEGEHKLIEEERNLTDEEIDELMIFVSNEVSSLQKREYSWRDREDMKEMIDICDGDHWGIVLYFDKECSNERETAQPWRVNYRGDNAYPPNWRKIEELFLEKYLGLPKGNYPLESFV